MSVALTYVNPSESCSLECSYEFPIDEKLILTSLSVEIDDIIMDSEVKDSQEIRDEYEENKARGDMAIKSEKKEYLVAKIGQILPKQQAILRLKII